MEALKRLYRIPTGTPPHTHAIAHVVQVCPRSQPAFMVMPQGPGVVFVVVKRAKLIQAREQGSRMSEDDEVTELLKVACPTMIRNQQFPRQTP